MCYIGFDGIVLQKKGEEKAKAVHVVSPDETGIHYLNKSIYPIPSEGYVLYLGVDYPKTKQVCFAIPEFNSPKITLEKDPYQNKYEFLFYHDTQYVCLVENANWSSNIQISIFHTNGTLIDRLEILQNFKGNF